MVHLPEKLASTSRTCLGWYWRGVLDLEIAKASWVLDIFSRTDIPGDIMVSCIEVQCDYETKENETSGSFRRGEKRHNYTFNEEHIYSSLLRHSSTCT
jgi:hypothetical protein